MNRVHPIQESKVKDNKKVSVDDRFDEDEAFLNLISTPQARTTKDFVIKKHVLKMITFEGPQTGQHIIEDVKKALKEDAGWEEDWTVN